MIKRLGHLEFDVILCQCGMYDERDWLSLEIQPLAFSIQL